MPPRNADPSLPTGVCARVRPLLDRYHDDALAAGPQEFVTRHLSTCEDCAAERAGLAALRSVLRGPVDAELADHPADVMWSRVSAELDRFATQKLGSAHLATQQAQRAWRMWARPALAMGTAAVLFTVALVAQPQDPQDVNVAKDTFTIDHIETGDGGVLVYETEATDMTIIWIIDAEEPPGAAGDQVAL